ncbi:MAG TPA: hypothetical protein VFA71_03835 [Terriglobales bacterium]|nr:hypothetical protein [Terriglobales bacterium]
MSKKRRKPKKKKNSRRPARRPVTRSKARSAPAGRYAVVRGAKRNPTPMIKKLTKAAAQKAAKFLRSHFPGAKVRVVSAKTTFV